MIRRSLRVPALIAVVTGALAVTVTVIAVGAGVTNPPADCARTATVDTVVVDSAARGASLDAGQLANAWIIYSVGAGLGLPPRAEIVAIAAAMQESALENLPYGSSDSLGLFQQRPSQGWGSPAQLMDPVVTARAFYEQLARLSNWQSLPITVAAQEVQRSSHPGAYARQAAEATRLVSAFAGGGGSCAVLDANVVPPGARASLPHRFGLPAGTPIAVTLAIRFAIAQLGTAYHFGGTCTDARSSDLALHCDCSSLVQQAYRAGGIPLPRTTFAQVDVGTPVYSLAALQPGDLLFTVGSDGSQGNPGHVGMYIGDGLVVQAPRTGQDVQLNPLSDWASQIVAMRRIA